MNSFINLWRHDDLEFPSKDQINFKLIKENVSYLTESFNNKLNMSYKFKKIFETFNLLVD